MTEAREVGDWILEREIGSGSFARVWKATHKQSQQVAAVKEINVDKLNKKLQESLASEVAVLNHTKHRNIVCLLDLIRDNNRLFIVLEYCAGGDLGHYIKRYRQASEATARYFLRQLAEGLKELRRHNVIHRDLKPQNLLLSASSSTPLLKIADFGFARSLAPQGLAETLCGSPLYMAPEILQFHKYDAKADLWSIGTILFELLAGKPPFNGANHVQLLRNIERNDAKLPDHVAARLSAPCKSLLGRLLQRNPVERISFEEFFSHPFLTGDAGPITGVPPSQPYPAAAAHALLPAAMRQAAVAATAAATVADKASTVVMPRPSLHLHGTLGGHVPQHTYSSTPMHTQLQQQSGPQRYELQQQLYPVPAYQPLAQQHRQQPVYQPTVQLQHHGAPQPSQQQQQGLLARPVANHPLAEAEVGEALSDSMEGDFVVVYNPNGSSGQRRSGSNSSSSKASSGLVDPKAAAVLQSAAPSARPVAWSVSAGQHQHPGHGGTGVWPMVPPAGQQQQQHNMHPTNMCHMPGHLAVDGPSVAGAAWPCMPPPSQLVPGGMSTHSAYVHEPSTAQRVQLLVQVVRGCVNLLLKQASGANDTVLPATQQSEQLALLLLALQLVQVMCLPHSTQQQQLDEERSQSCQHQCEDVCSLADLLGAASQAELEQLMSAAIDLLAVARTLLRSSSSEPDDAADPHQEAAAGSVPPRKMTQSLLQAQLPDPFVVLYQRALDSCRSAAVEEVMGNWQGSIAGYSLAADLLLFLSFEWQQLGPGDPCLLAEERHALHKLYDAVNERLAAVVAEAPSAVL